MKKIQLAALVLVASMSMSAENTTKLRVWIGGEKTEYELSMVDSLTFCTNTDDEPEDPEAPLAGVFSVSADKQVKFSKGNLQYTQSTDTWTFAAQQYDMLGYANEENNALADKIDLFGWSGSTGAAKWGISTSMSDSDYSGDFADWGQNIGDGNTWRTLTKDEWEYVLSSRSDADKKIGKARINLDEAGTTFVNGHILLPDTWTCPEGITFTTTTGSYENNTFTHEQWQKLEAAGAVFLPASGMRSMSSIDSVQYLSYYWSATEAGMNYAYAQTIYSSPFSFRCYGFSVRLVQDL